VHEVSVRVFGAPAQTPTQRTQDGRKKQYRLRLLRLTMSKGFMSSTRMPDGA